jgi:hypothetical protein
MITYSIIISVDSIIVSAGTQSPKFEYLTPQQQQLLNHGFLEVVVFLIKKLFMAPFLFYQLILSFSFLPFFHFQMHTS